MCDIQVGFAYHDRSWYTSAPSEDDDDTEDFTIEVTYVGKRWVKYISHEDYEEYRMGLKKFKSTFNIEEGWDNHLGCKHWPNCHEGSGCGEV
jgi:hypothetical protein